MDKVVGIAIALGGGKDRWGNEFEKGREYHAEIRETCMELDWFHRVPLNDPAWKFVPKGQDTPLKVLRDKYCYSINENWAHRFLFEHYGPNDRFEGEVKACPIDEGERGYAIEFACVSGETPDSWRFFRLQERVCLWSPPRSSDSDSSDGFMETTLWGT